MKNKTTFRHLIIFHVFMFLSPMLFSQKNIKKQFVLQGKIDGAETGLVRLEYVNSLKLFVTDSCYLTNGSFKFSGLIDEPTFAWFYGQTRPKGVDGPNSADIFLEPGSMQVYYKADDFKKGKVTGSKSQTEYNLYYSRMLDVPKKWKKTLDALHKSQEVDDTVTTNKIIEEELPLFEKDEKAVISNFIKEFPSSYVSALALVNWMHSWPIDSLKASYSILSSTLQKSVNGKIVADFIQNTQKLAIGMPAPDFIRPDMNGNTISLKDFKGKYILLDFWASWCGPCRQEYPNLRKAYRLYHDKGFNIIGVSLDLPDFKDAWLKAIKTDSLSWTQLSLDREVIKEYDVLQIPASFLIDPDGKIAFKGLRGEELEKKLAEIIK